MDGHQSSLAKAENPKQYAKLANEGIMIGYPVKINGLEKRPDNDITYHSTVKYFDPSKDHPHKIHELAQHLPLNPPDAKNTQIEPGQFKDRFGNDVFVIKLHGNSAEKIKEHNGKFAHMGFPSTFAYAPHVSVDKATHDKIKASGAKTAHEAGIEFGPAQLRKGPSVLKTYHHEPDTTEPKVPDEGDMEAKVGKSENVLGKKPLMKPYVSDAQRRWAHTNTGTEALGGKAHVHEWDEATKGKKLPERVKKSDEVLEKGAFKNAGIALGMASALAGGHAGAADRSPASIPNHAGIKALSYDHKKMLNAIAAVESSGGKNVNHAAGGGPIHGSEHAFGKFGLMPETIRETIKGHKDLKSKYGKALALKGPQMHRFMQDNKGLEDVIADRHLSHMEHVLGNNPSHLGYGWLEGIQGTLNAKKSGADIDNHWHAKKVRDAYDKGK